MFHSVTIPTAAKISPTNKSPTSPVAKLMMAQAVATVNGTTGFIPFLLL